MSSLPLLSSAAAGQPSSSRFASCFVAKPARGFQVLRIDGYSWTKALPGGERITSKLFIIGGRSWRVDYYPNGADGSRDESDSIALYLRLVVDHGITKERVRAQYRFSLLDLDGNAAYERPEETAIFTSARPQPLMPESYTYGLGLPVDDTGGGGQAPATSTVAEDIGCGYAAFITREELESRRDSLLKEDCLAIRCDVGVTEVTPMSVVGPTTLPPGIVPPLAPRRYRYNYGGYLGDNLGDDGEFVGWDGLAARAGVVSSNRRRMTRSTSAAASAKRSRE